MNEETMATRRIYKSVADQLDGGYRRMAQEAHYRPAAPSDGFGNITTPLAELDLDEEALAYALRWWAEEEGGEFLVGSCNFSTRPATVYAIEAARLMCGAANRPALALLRMAVRELEQTLEEER